MIGHIGTYLTKRFGQKPIRSSPGNNEQTILFFQRNRSLRVSYRKVVYKHYTYTIVLQTIGAYVHTFIGFSVPDNLEYTNKKRMKQNRIELKKQQALQREKKLKKMRMQRYFDLEKLKITDCQVLEIV